jgi:L-seryl-tRNA(Ser) seleniumtransferase
LPKEPVVAESVALGADLVTFSGDKLLGGPQAGLVVGRRDLIDRLQRNPLKRALRCDKLTLAALAATLRLYRTAPDLGAALPTLRFLKRPLAEIDAVGQAALSALRANLGAEYRIDLVDTQAEFGSGALPTATLPSRALAVRHTTEGADTVAARFRAADPPIVGRVQDGAVLLDLRMIYDANDLIPRLAHGA